MGFPDNLSSGLCEKGLGSYFPRYSRYSLLGLGFAGLKFRGHFLVGSFRYMSLIAGLYTL